jgi:hypothetical protein
MSNLKWQCKFSCTFTIENASREKHIKIVVGQATNNNIDMETGEVY